MKLKRPESGWVWLAVVLGSVLLVLGALVAYVWWDVLPKEPHLEVSFPGDEHPPKTLSEGDQAVLLKKLAPIFSFAPGEEWRPIPIDAFLADSVVERRSDGWRPPEHPVPPTESTLPRGEGYRLDLTACAAANGAGCYEGESPAIRRVPAAVYGRVWLNDTGKHPKIGYVVQYWAFYYFDDWRNSQSAPTIWQLHEGDWENVSIGLSRRCRPIYAAYSQHRAGHWRWWRDVGVSPGGHPHVYVALGSHANYFEAGVHPVPLDFLPSYVRPFVGSYGFRDVAGRIEPVGPGQPSLRVVPTAEDELWLAYEGAWGESEWVRWLPRHGGWRRHQLGLGPTGPVEKGSLWSNPAQATLSGWKVDPVARVERAGEKGASRGASKIKACSARS